MNILVRALVATPLTCVVAPLGAETPAPPPSSIARVPEILFAPTESTQPVWVAASAALTESGDLRQDLLGATAIEGFQRARSVHAREMLTDAGSTGSEPRDLTSEQCRGVMISNSRQHQTLSDELVTKNLWVSADVEAITPGFLSRQPGTLLTLSVTRDLQNPGSPAPSRTLHVFLPRARFALGSWPFCVGELAPPKVGAHVLVVARVFPVDDKGLIVQSGDGGILGEDSTGTLQIPRTWRTDPLVSRQKALVDLEALFIDALRNRAKPLERLPQPE